PGLPPSAMPTAAMPGVAPPGWPPSGPSPASGPMQPAAHPHPPGVPHHREPAPAMVIPGEAAGSHEPTESVRLPPRASHRSRAGLIGLVVIAVAVAGVILFLLTRGDPSPEAPANVAGAFAATSGSPADAALAAPVVPDAALAVAVADAAPPPDAT